MPEIKMYRRPDKSEVDQIIEIVKALTGKWFTEDVAEDTKRDLLFQDAICLIENNRIISFIIFTSWDGDMNITLMGTHPKSRGKGYGSILIKAFYKYIKEIGFNRVRVLTVPPDKKSSYESTVNFYLRNGFVMTKRYTEIWGCGAIELIKELK